MTPPIDFETRELCPDDACIGVLDARGVCPECGKRAKRKTALSTSSGLPESQTEIESAPGSLEDVIEHAAEAASFDDEDRELCGDDACIGLIGPNGRCKECGRPRQS